MKITICGYPGSGKGTVSKILAQKLQYAHYSAGGQRRAAAKAKGMTLSEFNKWSEKNLKEGDKYFDDQQKKVGKEQNNFIFDGRLSFFFIPDSVKIYLNVDPLIGANRIFKDVKNGLRKEENVASEEEMLKLIKQRVASDKRRYEKLYEIPIYEMRMFDIVIDTTDKSAEETAKIILKIIKTYQ